jgi:Xaa-Pro aminopeptidase
MRYKKIDNNLFIKNREKLQSHLINNSVAIFTSNDIMPENGDGTFEFKQNSDLFYLSGIDEAETVLLLYPDAKRQEWKEILFIKEIDLKSQIWEGDGLSKENATDISGIENVMWVSEFDSIFQGVMSCLDNVYLNSNEHTRAKAEVQTRADRFIFFCKKRYPLHTYNRLAPIMARLRAVKSEIEIELIRQACAITEKGFRRILPLVRDGMMEYEIEAELGCEFIKNASSGFAYSPIIASGKNSCILHYSSNNSRLKEGEVLLLDIGAKYANYSSDTTRVIPIGGKFSVKQKKIYKSVLSILNAAEKLLVVGLSLESYYNSVVEIVKEELSKIGLLSVSSFQSNKKSDEYKKYFMHNVIHHLGLDTHDWAPYDMLIQHNMVFAIEPGIYIREEGIGVRLENNYVMCKTGVENLTKSMPIDLDEIEELMITKY